MWANPNPTICMFFYTTRSGVGAHGRGLLTQARARRCGLAEDGSVAEEKGRSKRCGMLKRVSLPPLAFTALQMSSELVYG